MTVRSRYRTLSRYEELIISDIVTRFGLTGSASGWVRILFEREETEIKRSSFIGRIFNLMAWFSAWSVSLMLATVLVNPGLGVRMLARCGLHPESGERPVLVAASLVWILFVSSLFLSALECRLETREEKLERDTILSAHTYFLDSYSTSSYFACVPLLVAFWRMRDGS